jgi:hypothetical protein
VCISLDRECGIVCKCKVLLRKVGILANFETSLPVYRTSIYYGIGHYQKGLTR